MPKYESKIKLENEIFFKYILCKLVFKIRKKITKIKGS